MPTTKTRPPTAELPELATREQIADYFQVSVDTVDRWRRNGQGPRAIKLAGGNVRYPRAAVNEYTAALAAQ